MLTCGWETQMELGCSSVGRASDRHAADAGSIPRCGKIFFFPRVNFQCRLSSGVRTSPCAIACINICRHDKDPVVHVRVRWIMATQKYSARTISDTNNQFDDCGRPAERKKAGYVPGPFYHTSSFSFCVILLRQSRALFLPPASWHQTDTR